MSHDEQRREMLPSRLSDVAPAAALFATAGRFDEPGRFASPPPRHSRGSAAGWVGRGFRRHWWQILPLWLAASAGAWFLAHRLFPNSYEASSIVQVEAGDPTLGRLGTADAKFATFKQTQARRIATPTVVASALTDHPELGQQLAAASHMDQEGAILRGLSAAVPDGTDLIQVSMTAAADDGLAAIVDAVVAAYLRVATDFNQENSAQSSIKLRQLLRVKEDQVKAKRTDVKKLVEQHGVVDAEQGRERHAAAIGRRAELSDKLLAIDLEIVKAQKELEQAQHDAAAPPPPTTTTRPGGNAAAEAVRRAFYGSPEVATLNDQRVEAKGKLKEIEREPAKTPDADRRALQGRIEGLTRQIDALWAELEPGLRIAVQAEPPPPATALATGEAGRIEGRLNGLKAQQAMLADRLEGMKGETIAGGSDVLNLAFSRQDLARAEAVLDTMTQTFNQADVVSNQPVARFRQEGRAKTVEKSAAPARLSVLAAGPLLALVLLLGLFGLVERHVGRIFDPIDLPLRAHLDVIGLVPPLPKQRGGGRLGLGAIPTGGNSRSQEDVERFIQSLDQLRVLVCGRGDAQGRPNRSLLITSASEGEGKSTLAAQLAERSVTAGLLTLLVDADLRNPTLSRMFDRPDSVGLANVLRGELLAEEAIGTVPEAGGFHFLPAGLVRDDLSRLLQSDRLARFLESARESFDLVLVDSPPVLPVADALTIGRCVDAAIITVRHKVSRLPMVERASRQLSSVGITILGAVVSGVKDRFAPYYGPRPATDPNHDTSVEAAG